MKHGTTRSGFTYDFDEQRANDMRVLKHVHSCLDPEASPLEKTSALLDLPGLLLGKEQTDALYNHLAGLNGGRVPPADLERELIDIMQGGGENSKN